jgi:hypothetical protein
VFYSLADGADGGRYYDVHKIENMRHALTILAYEMNGAPVSVPHGAPLRRRPPNARTYADSALGRQPCRRWISASLRGLWNKKTQEQEATALVEPRPRGDYTGGTFRACS